MHYVAVYVIAQRLVSCHLCIQTDLCESCCKLTRSSETKSEIPLLTCTQPGKPLFLPASWNKDMPDFFQNMPGRGEAGVYANIWEDLDTTPAVWHITEVSLADSISVCLFTEQTHKHRECTVHVCRCSLCARAVVMPVH